LHHDERHNQLDDEYFSKDHDRTINLLDFEAFVKKYYARETEMNEEMLRLAQVVAAGVDIWNTYGEEPTETNPTVTKLRDHFCSYYLPLASNSQFVEAGVKEAKIVSTTGRNEELRSVYAICRSFLFGKLKQSTNNPARVNQILTVVIEQNSIHQNEINKLAREERRKVLTSALMENHFRKGRLEKKQKNISKKGSADKADNVTQRLEGVHDTAFIDGKIQYGKLLKIEHTRDLAIELTYRGLDGSLSLGFREKIKALKKNEANRDPKGDEKYFFPQSEAPFIISKH
jgi:hypothetical protein